MCTPTVAEICDVKQHTFSEHLYIIVTPPPLQEILQVEDILTPGNV